MIRAMTSYCLWRVIASLVPDLSKTFREAHYELARLTQVGELLSEIERE